MIEDHLAGIIYQALSNANYRPRKVLEGLIHAVEYDGENMVIINMQNGQRFNLTVTEEKKP
jgi:hypothetical protein